MWGLQLALKNVVFGHTIPFFSGPPNHKIVYLTLVKTMCFASINTRLMPTPMKMKIHLSANIQVEK